MANPFLFAKFQRANFIAKTNIFSYSLLVFVFATVGANFLKARAARDSSPHPSSRAARADSPSEARRHLSSKYFRATFRVSHIGHARKANGIAKLELLVHTARKDFRDIRDEGVRTVSYRHHRIKQSYAEIRLYNQKFNQRYRSFHICICCGVAWF